MRTYWVCSRYFILVALLHLLHDDSWGGGHRYVCAFERRVVLCRTISEPIIVRDCLLRTAVADQMTGIYCQIIEVTSVREQRHKKTSQIKLWFSSPTLTAVGCNVMANTSICCACKQPRGAFLELVKFVVLCLLCLYHFLF